MLVVSKMFQKYLPLFSSGKYFNNLCVELVRASQVKKLVFSSAYYSNGIANTQWNHTKEFDIYVIGNTSTRDYTGVLIDVEQNA